MNQQNPNPQQPIINNPGTSYGQSDPRGDTVKYVKFEGVKFTSQVEYFNANGNPCTEAEAVHVAVTPFINGQLTPYACFGDVDRRDPAVSRPLKEEALKKELKARKIYGICSIVLPIIFLTIGLWVVPIGVLSLFGTFFCVGMWLEKYNAFFGSMHGKPIAKFLLLRIELDLNLVNTRIINR